jgi:hypothetical protein
MGRPPNGWRAAPRLSNPGPRRNVGFTLPIDVDALLVAKAAEEDRTFASIVRAALTAYLTRRE